MPERIPISADHAGFELKQKLESHLRERGFEVDDLGANSPTSSDYPDYAHPLAKQVSDGEAKRGVMLCGTGLGMAYVANRYPHVRAAVVWSPEIAELARKHNDANVLVLPARFLSEADAEKILDVWLDTAFEGGRHERRVAKIEREEASE
jgi:ribose 5-phosphate isomerase B